MSSPCGSPTVKSRTAVMTCVTSSPGSMSFGDAYTHSRIRSSPNSVPSAFDASDTPSLNVTSGGRIFGPCHTDDGRTLGMAQPLLE